MPPVHGQHIGVDLGTFNRLVAHELTDDLERARVQQQVNGKAVPEGVTGDIDRRAPYPLHELMDVPVHGLARHRKNPLVLAKMPRVQVALDAVLQ